MIHQHYADFKDTNKESVTLKFEGNDKYKKNSKILLEKYYNQKNKNHNFMYGIQTSLNYHSFFYDFFTCYTTMLCYCKHFYYGFGIVFIVPGYLFTRENLLLTRKYKDLFFFGPVFIPIIYKNENTAVELQIQTLFTAQFLKKSTVISEITDNNIYQDKNTILLSEEVSDSSCISEYGFFSTVIGIKIVKKFINLFAGTRFTLHSENLDIFHLIKHIMHFEWYQMFFRHSRCYNQNAYCRTKYPTQENNKKIIKMVLQKMIYCEYVFCSCDFVFSISFLI